MRLLLLLSALLTALSGAVGTRAQAQPVAAASALAASPGAVLVRRAALPFLPASAAVLSPAALPTMPRLVSAVVARRLFAERRRE